MRYDPFLVLLRAQDRYASRFPAPRPKPRRRGRALPTYDQLAGLWGVQVCWGCDACDHYRGRVIDGVIHWQDRRPRRAGLRRFALLVGRVFTAIKDPELPPSERIFEEVRTAQWLLGLVGVREARRQWRTEALRAAAAAHRSLPPEVRRWITSVAGR